jgi:hypothetical protein
VSALSSEDAFTDPAAGEEELELGSLRSWT